MIEDFVKARRTGKTIGVHVQGLIYDLPRSQVTGDGWEVLTAPAERERVTEPAPAQPAKRKGGKARGK